MTCNDSGDNVYLAQTSTGHSESLIGSAFAVLVVAIVAWAYWKLGRASGPENPDTSLGLSIAVSNRHTEANEKSRLAAHLAAKKYYLGISAVCGCAFLAGVAALCVRNGTYAALCAIAAFVACIPVFIAAGFSATAAAKRSAPDQ